MAIAAIILLLIGSIGMGLSKKYDWNNFSHFMWKSTLATILTISGVILSFFAFGWYGFIPVSVAMLITRGISGK